MNKLLRVLGKRGRITIPYEIRQRLGFAYNDVLTFSEAKDGRTVIVKREKLCDNCTGRKPTEYETTDLENFLNDLSTEQQQKALIHLSIKWAERQGDILDVKTNPSI